MLRRSIVAAFSLALFFLTALAFEPRVAGADSCKADGQSCRTNQSCCGGVCVNTAPIGKRPGQMRSKDSCTTKEFV